MIGANFEARPNVALDVAGQLLKSLNTGVLRTGAAALGTVTTLVDRCCGPGLERAGLPAGAIGLVRSADHEGARILVSLPGLIPLVILRGSGETTAQLARLAAENGVRTLAHAEGGGVLYVHERGRHRQGALGSPRRASTASASATGSTSPSSTAGAAAVPSRPARALPRKGTRDPRDRAGRRGGDGLLPLDRPLGHEWASDPGRVATITVDVVDDLDEAVRVANEETSGLAAGIVTEDAEAAERFLDTYRGTAAFWHAPTRFADGFELTGAPETGINVDWTPGPRGPVTYGDLYLRQYRILGDGTQRR